MSRKMPPLVAAFKTHVNEALALSEAGEQARALAGPKSPVRKELSIRRLEALYEMALLKAFVEWEVFLEATFVRYLCGYTSIHGPLPLLPGCNYAPTLQAAEATMLNGASFALWHNPAKVLARCQRHFSAGCNYELVISSSTARIQDMAYVRHRIAHGGKDAIHKFNDSTLSFVGKLYPGASPGRFLRDWVPGKTPPTRWLSELTHELVALAGQIA